MPNNIAHLKQPQMMVELEFLPIAERSLVDVERLAVNTRLMAVMLELV